MGQYAGLVKQTNGGSAFSEIKSGLSGLANIGGMIGGAVDTVKNATNPAYNYLGKLNPGYNPDGSKIVTAAPVTHGSPAVTPAPPTSGPLAGGAGGAASSQDAVDKANALFGIDTGLSSANDALGRLDSQAATGYGNIDRQYQDGYNRLDATHQLGNAQYDQNTTGQLNEYQSNRNQVASQSRNWLDSARRTLGAQGAGGGSAARYGVPYQAQQQAAQGNAAAQSTNNHNMTALLQGHQQDEDKFANSAADLKSQRDQGRNDYQTQIDNQRATLLGTIGQLMGQKQIANGGDYKAALAAASPYTSQLPAIMARIDALAATPAVHEQQYTLSKPDLSGYNWSRGQAPVVAQQDPTLAAPGYVPAYGQDNQDQQDPIASLFGLQDPNQRQYA